MSIFINLHRVWQRSRNNLRLRLSGIVGLVATSIIGNAVCFRYFDSTDTHIIQWGDAVWYSVISITTIGYGDFYATSLGARLGTVIFVVIVGLFAFTMLLGVLTERGLAYLEKGRNGMGHSIEKGHMLIVNYPGKQRLTQLLQEIWADSSQRNGHKQRIVLVTDSIEEIPVVDGPLEFINGSPLDENSYQRAAAQDAKLALILPADYNNNSSDAITESALEVLSHYAPDLKIVAECLNKNLSHLFSHAGENCSIVCANHIATNMMIQELADSGIAACMEEITSNTHGATLYTTTVVDLSDEDAHTNYIDISHRLLQTDINLVAVSRDKKVQSMFSTMSIHKNDALVYIAKERFDWATLRSHALGQGPQA